MYLCICNEVRQIEAERAIADGVHEFAEFARRSGCSMSCGTCREEAELVFKQMLAKQIAQTKAQGKAKPFVVPVLACA